MKLSLDKTSSIRGSALYVATVHDLPGRPIRPACIGEITSIRPVAGSVVGVTNPSLIQSRFVDAPRLSANG